MSVSRSLVSQCKKIWTFSLTLEEVVTLGLSQMLSILCNGSGAGNNQSFVTIFSWKCRILFLRTCMRPIHITYKSTIFPNLLILSKGALLAKSDFSCFCLWYDDFELQSLYISMKYLGRIVFTKLGELAEGFEESHLH